MSSGYDDGWLSHRERSYDVNSRIMLIAIVSLSFVIIAVTFLHIYARCLLRRQARRQAAFAQLDLFTISVNPNAAAADPPRTGLEPAVLAALPVFAFKQILPDDNKRNDDHVDDNMERLIGPTECSVCLSTLEEGELVRTLPNCKHTFHADCIDLWFGSNSTCPICRTEAQPRLVAEPREGVTGLHPSAPPLDATSSDRMQIPGKMIASTAAGPSSSSSRLSSFRRIIERSSRRMQNQSSDNSLPDLERQ